MLPHSVLEQYGVDRPESPFAGQPALFLWRRVVYRRLPGSTLRRSTAMKRSHPKAGYEGDEGDTEHFSGRRLFTFRPMTISCKNRFSVFGRKEAPAIPHKNKIGKIAAGAVPVIDVRHHRPIQPGFNPVAEQRSPAPLGSPLQKIQYFLQL